MSAETQEAQSRGPQVLQQPAGQFRRLRSTAAGAAGRLRSLLHIGGGRKRTTPPAASVSLLQLRTEGDTDPETRKALAQWGSAKPSVTRAAKKGTFPCRLCLGSAGALKECQDLVTTGSRQFGLGGFGAALKVRIYDFAVYVQPQQAKASALCKNSPNLQTPAQHVSFCKGLRSSDDIDMSLMVRASRNLPIKLLAKEYERILRRRIVKVGGSQTDEALVNLLHTFKEENLPESVKQGGSVKKGTLLAFIKHGSSSMTAKADGKTLATVSSPKLCQAVFDLYLGDQPVSTESRAAAGTAVMGMMGTLTYQTPEQKGLCVAGTDSYSIL